MLQLENHTPFEAALHVFPDESGVDTLYVTVKATFAFGGGVLEVAEQQLPLQLADEYAGEPGVSGLRYACDSHLGRPSTNVALVGAAQAPGRRAVEEIDATVSVGPVRKTVRVFGDREWTSPRFGRRSAPLTFETMPLVWERAFGGVHEADPDKGKVYAEERNPVGTGFRGKRSYREFGGALLPNLEDPGRMLSRPGAKSAPACFGFVAPHWQPRSAFAGTYDEKWQRSRIPYLPEDFDRRFFNAAVPDLVCPGHLSGGEPVELLNVSAEGPLRFPLPRCDLEQTVWLRGTTHPASFRLETVLFEPEDARFSMTWRSALPCDKSALAVQLVRLELRHMDCAKQAA